MTSRKDNHPLGRMLLSDLLLLMAALIWGSTFVAQKAGMAFIGPFTYNTVRFAIAVVILFPFGFIFQKFLPGKPSFRRHWGPGLLTGMALWAGATLQQWGLIHTTAGNAGFITGLYVVMVPLVTLLRSRGVLWNQFAGALLAFVGLYFLSVSVRFTISKGDLLVGFGALFWTLHIMLTDRFSKELNPVWFVQIQNGVTAVISLLAALIFEHITLTGINNAAVPILYSGCLSVGIAFVLQAAAQQRAHPVHASVIMSLEGVFAALGGAILLGERLSPRQLLGAGLMLCGMLICQIRKIKIPLEKPGT